MSTLALNMIVGPKEARLLDRCLKSFDAKNVFDEIVIVNTSLDQDVNTIAKRYTDKVYYYQWETEDHPHGDFGGARDYARKMTESDKIWWLDTDDVCLERYSLKLRESVALIKDDKYNDVMIWIMPYAIILDDSSNPDMWFKRERVFDRKNIQWKRNVHELMFPGAEMVKTARINNMYITHMPDKPTYASALRNVAILEDEYAKNKNDIQTKYFLGRDYMFVGQVEKGISLLEEILSSLSVGSEMLYAIAIELAWFYSYGCINPHPEIELYKKENKIKVEGYCRLALTFSYDYAEPYVLLGDTYVCDENYDSAARMYQTAIRKKLGVGKFQTQPLYLEIPSDRLSRIFEARKMFGLAIHHNEVAKRANDKNGYYFERKELLLKKFNDEVDNERKDRSTERAEIVCA